MATRLVQAISPEPLARTQADAARDASRLFANALVNVAWRNGPVENIHAGGFRGYPLAQRRVTSAEEKELMQSESDGLALGMTVCQVLARERPQRSWSEQVLPYGLASTMLITPSRWTLTEASREVRLPPATAEREDNVRRGRRAGHPDDHDVDRRGRHRRSCG
jgi:hypothetical protein